MAVWGSHMWYLIATSNMRKKNHKTDDPLVTRKTRRARHMFTTRPGNRAKLSSFASNQIKNSKQLNLLVLSVCAT